MLDSHSQYTISPKMKLLYISFVNYFMHASLSQINWWLTDSLKTHSISSPTHASILQQQQQKMGITQSILPN